MFHTRWIACHLLLLNEAKRVPITCLVIVSCASFWQIWSSVNSQLFFLKRPWWQRLHESYLSAQPCLLPARQMQGSRSLSSFPDSPYCLPLSSPNRRPEIFELQQPWNANLSLTPKSEFDENPWRKAKVYTPHGWNLVLTSLPSALVWYLQYRWYVRRTWNGWRRKMKGRKRRREEEKKEGRGGGKERNEGRKVEKGIGGSQEGNLHPSPHWFDQVQLSQIPSPFPDFLARQRSKIPQRYISSPVFSPHWF